MLYAVAKTQYGTQAKLAVPYFVGGGEDFGFVCAEIRNRRRGASRVVAKLKSKADQMPVYMDSDSVRGFLERNGAQHIRVLPDPDVADAFVAARFCQSLDGELGRFKQRSPRRLTPLERGFGVFPVGRVLVFEHSAEEDRWGAHLARLEDWERYPWFALTRTKQENLRENVGRWFLLNSLEEVYSECPFFLYLKTTLLKPDASASESGDVNSFPSQLTAARSAASTSVTEPHGMNPTPSTVGPVEAEAKTQPEPRCD